MRNKDSNKNCHLPSKVGLGPTSTKSNQAMQCLGIPTEKLY